MNFLLILLIIFIKSESYLKLVFNDEFNESDSIDENKWDITEQKNYCDWHKVNQLYCNTNDKINIRIINGSLALAAIRRKHSNKFYTAPFITTKRSFSSARFEFRAALPKGKMIETVLLFKPVTGLVAWFMMNKQGPDFYHGSSSYDSIYQATYKSSIVNENLNEFQIYVMEWNESEFKFIFNDRVLQTINNTNEWKNNSFFTENYFLFLYLDIGSNRVPGQILYENDVQEWECSLMLIDYIRVYQNVEEEIENIRVLPEPNNITASDICSQVMPLVRPSKPKWKLIFAEEFTGNNIDQNIWKIKHDEDYFSDNRYKQLNHNTNSSKNIRLTDGTLVLAAIRENYLNKEFTAPLISTKRSFKYGRFEIRAALPVGKLLRPHIFLEPIEEKYKKLKIDFLINTQLEEFKYGFHLAESVFSKSSNSNNLFQFHIYTMEWTETEFMWMFDNMSFQPISFQEIGTELLDIPMRLVISLGVGGTDFDNENLTSIEADKWLCSLLILDYIRVYGIENEIPNNYEQNNITSSEICTKIMPTIKWMKKEVSTLNMIQIISISGFLLFLSTIPFTIYLFIRIKRYRVKMSSGHIGGIDNMLEQNEAIFLDNHYETITYQEHQFPINEPNEEQNYLAITNKYKVTENDDYLVMNREPQVDSI